MAVPKKRTTKASRNQRRSHDALKAPQLTGVGAASVPHRFAKATKLGLRKTP